MRKVAGQRSDFFAGTRGWFPSGATIRAGVTGSRTSRTWQPPVPALLTLTLGYIGEYAIIMRSSLLEVMNDDFVQTARAKGVQDRLVRRHHAVPNAILPTFTLIFLSFGFVLGGAIIVETVFSWPGIGLLTYEAIQGWNTLIQRCSCWQAPPSSSSTWFADGHTLSTSDPGGMRSRTSTI